MIWTTKTTYVDRETGEQLRKQHIEQNIYIKIKSHVKYEKNSINYGTRHITWECERNNQTRLF